MFRYSILGGGNSNIFFFIFTPIWGKISHFDEHIFQGGWNHQLVGSRRVDLDLRSLVVWRSNPEPCIIQSQKKWRVQWVLGIYTYVYIYTYIYVQEAAKEDHHFRLLCFVFVGDVWGLNLSANYPEKHHWLVKLLVLTLQKPGSQS